MRVLVTGAAGFVGRHLAADLVAHGHGVAGLDRAAGDIPAACGAGGFEADVTDAGAVRAAVRAAAPEACVHLAALASVPDCEANPERAYEVNVRGTLNLLSAVRRAEEPARVLVVSSAHVYAPASPGKVISEDGPPGPHTLYGLTKLSADLLALHLARAQGLPFLTVRPVNHAGPGQSSAYAVAALADRIVQIARGRAEPVLRVGNLASTRDILDVRDTVCAYRLLVERGCPGRAYNLAGGRSIRIGEIVEQLCRLAGIRPRIEVDPALFRPTDHSPGLDTARIRADTGWAPAISIERTIEDVYRSRLKSAEAGCPGDRPASRPPGNERCDRPRSR